MKKFTEFEFPVPLHNNLLSNISVMKYTHKNKLRVILLLCVLGVIYISYTLLLEYRIITW